LAFFYGKALFFFFSSQRLLYKKIKFHTCFFFKQQFESSKLRIPISKPAKHIFI